LANRRILAYDPVRKISDNGGGPTHRRLIEFFAARIHNRNTRAAGNR
jgi:hypothetical protein